MIDKNEFLFGVIIALWVIFGGLVTWNIFGNSREPAVYEVTTEVSFRWEGIDSDNLVRTQRMNYIVRVDRKTVKLEVGVDSIKGDTKNGIYTVYVVGTPKDEDGNMVGDRYVHFHQNFLIAPGLTPKIIKYETSANRIK